MSSWSVRRRASRPWRPARYASPPRGSVSPSHEKQMHVRPSQSRVAFSRMRRTRAPASPGELEITFSTSRSRSAAPAIREIVSTLLHVVEQPHVFDRDHGLVGESRGQLDLLGGERADLIAPDHDDADSASSRNIGTPSMVRYPPSLCDRPAGNQARREHRECGPAGDLEGPVQSSIRVPGEFVFLRCAPRIRLLRRKNCEPVDIAVGQKNESLGAARAGGVFQLTSPARSADRMPRG